MYTLVTLTDPRWGQLVQRCCRCEDIYGGWPLVTAALLENTDLIGHHHYYDLPLVTAALRANTDLTGHHHHYFPLSSRQHIGWLHWSLPTTTFTT